MKQLNLESLETRTLLAVGDVLDGEMADKVADLAGKLLEDVFNGDTEKLSDAEALARKYLDIGSSSDPSPEDVDTGSSSDETETKKKKSKVGKLKSKFEKLAGGLVDKLTGDDSDEEDAGAKSSSQDGDDSSLFAKIGDAVGGVVDKIKGDSSAEENNDSDGNGDSVSDADSDGGGLFDKIGGAFGKVTHLFDGLNPDKELDASNEKVSNVLGKVRDRIHAFGGEDSPAGGKVGVAAAHLLDVTSDVIDTLTGFIDDATDSSPEKEARVEMALKVAAAALKGVSDVSSLVGAAVPGVSAAGPALNVASGALEKASGESSKFVKGAERLGNIIGKGGHAAASALDSLSDRLDPQNVAETPEGEASEALQQEAEALVV